VNASTRAAKARTATIWGTPRSTTEVEVDQYRGTDRRTNAAESAHADPANSAEIRGLISTGSWLDADDSLARAVTYLLTLHGDLPQNVTATVKRES
jgi:hypothetical protein